MSVELTPENNYTIGGEIYNPPRNDAYKVSEPRDSQRRT
jgi:hypothetical protein